MSIVTREDNFALAGNGLHRIVKANDRSVKWFQLFYLLLFLPYLIHQTQGNLVKSITQKQQLKSPLVQN